MPIALAVLMSFLLAPPVRLLQGWRVPRGLAITVVVVVAFAAIFNLGGLMVSEVNQLAIDLPRYQSTLSAKNSEPARRDGRDRHARTRFRGVARVKQRPQYAETRRSGARCSDAQERTFQRRHSGGNSATQLQRPADARGHRHVAGRSAHHRRDCRDLRNFHSRSKAGLEEPAGPTRRIKGYTAHDRGV